MLKGAEISAAVETALKNNFKFLSFLRRVPRNSVYACKQKREAAAATITTTTLSKTIANAGNSSYDNNNNKSTHSAL